MKIVISPFSVSAKIPKGKLHPKNYPFWRDLIKSLKLHHEIIQIGKSEEEILTHDFRFDLPFPKLLELIKEMDLFISVDNFFPHMVNSYYSKYAKTGIVIFSRSNPEVFGYPQNINLLKDKKYLRNGQFLYWDQCDYIEDAFPEPEKIIEAVNLYIPDPKGRITDEESCMADQTGSTGSTSGRGKREKREKLKAQLNCSRLNY